MMFIYQQLRTPQAVMAVGLLVAGVVTVGAGFFASRLHDAAVTRTEAVLQSLAVAIGEQTDRALESVATVERHVAERLERQIAQLDVPLEVAGTGPSIINNHVAKRAPSRHDDAAKSVLQ